MHLLYERTAWSRRRLHGRGWVHASAGSSGKTKTLTIERYLEDAVWNLNRSLIVSPPMPLFVPENDRGPCYRLQSTSPRPNQITLCIASLLTACCMAFTSTTAVNLRLDRRSDAPIVSGPSVTRTCLSFRNRCRPEELASSAVSTRLNWTSLSRRSAGAVRLSPGLVESERRRTQDVDFSAEIP